MQIVFDIVNPSNIVTNEEIKSTVTAILCHEIFVGRQVPPIIHVKLVKHPIRRQVGLRSGELRHVIGNPDRHRIVIHYQGRSKAEVLITLFHEFCHLIRVWNKENKDDLVLEEQENTAYMGKINNVVEWVSSTLITYSDGNLRRPMEIAE